MMRMTRWKAGLPFECGSDYTLAQANTTHDEKHDLLPEDGPPDDLYRLAVPIWTGQSHDVVAERRGKEYACGYALGFEEGIVMAMLRPEWAQGFYLKLREFYLTTHTDDDLLDWERCADHTAAAMPVGLHG